MSIFFMKTGVRQTNESLSYPNIYYRTKIKRLFKIPESFQTILVDEIQDFEKEWVAEVRSWLTPNGEIVFFGDEKQNIYKRTLEEVESEKTNSNLKRPYTGIRGNWHALKKTYRLANHIRKLTNEFQGYFLKENYDYEPLPIDLTFNQTSFNFKSVTYRLDYFYLPEGILTEEKLEKLYQIYRNVAVEYGVHDNDICFLGNTTCMGKIIEEFFNTKGKNFSITFETRKRYEALYAQYGINHSVEAVVAKVKSICRNEKLKAAVVVNEKLSPRERQLWGRYREFKLEIDKIRRSKKKGFNPGSGELKLSTIHSFKGWEIPTEILIIDNYNEKLDKRLMNIETGRQEGTRAESKLDSVSLCIDGETIDTSEIDELIYTAITRARKNLIIINLGNQRYDSFFRQAKSVKVCNIEDLNA